MPRLMENIEQFMNMGLTPLAFVMIFVILLKVMRMIRTNRDLIMFYGKQVDELRKMMAHQPKRPQVSADDTGLYEVLSE